MKETDLFPPLKIWLENQGYKVHSEVKNCDIAARKGEELIIVELKIRLTVTLLIQAVKRKELEESVYVAIPVNGSNSYPANLGGIKALLRRLEVGLILVRFMKTKTRIEVILHPQEFKRKRMHEKRKAIIREIDGRYGEFDKAGAPSTTERITAYKQEAVKTAFLLKKFGPSSPKELKQKGGYAKVGTMLSRNVYGWFDRIEHGIYDLNEAGKAALKNYDKVVKAVKSAENL